MKAKRKSQSLRLNRETVKALSGPQLARVMGGDATDNYCDSNVSEANCGFSIICYTNHCFTAACDQPVIK